MGGLDEFTDHQLLEELVRRANNGSPQDEPKDYCEECSNFVLWTKRGDPPKSYNPCAIGHKMHFKMPADYEFTDFGFYRLICSDRDELPS